MADINWKFLRILEGQGSIAGLGHSCHCSFEIRSIDCSVNTVLESNIVGWESMIGNRCSIGMLDSWTVFASNFYSCSWPENADCTMLTFPSVRGSAPKLYTCIKGAEQKTPTFPPTHRIFTDFFLAKAQLSRDFLLSPSELQCCLFRETHGNMAKAVAECSHGFGYPRSLT